MVWLNRVGMLLEFFSFFLIAIETVSTIRGDNGEWLREVSQKIGLILRRNALILLEIIFFFSSILGLIGLSLGVLTWLSGSLNIVGGWERILVNTNFFFALLGLGLVFFGWFTKLILEYSIVTPENIGGFRSKDTLIQDLFLLAMRFTFLVGVFIPLLATFIFVSEVWNGIQLPLRLLLFMVLLWTLSISSIILTIEHLRLKPMDIPKTTLFIIVTALWAISLCMITELTIDTLSELVAMIGTLINISVLLFVLISILFHLFPIVWQLLADNRVTRVFLFWFGVSLFVIGFFFQFTATFV